ncbi:MAG: hypothetical protein AAGB11_10605 [Pseudomonadota bacterium]
MASTIGAPAGVVATEGKPRWFSNVGEAGAFARWGIPETDAVGFVVSCEEGGVSLLPALYAVDKPSATPGVRFIVDGDDYVRDAQLRFSEEDAAWQALVAVNAEDSLITAMRRGNELTYDFEPPLREGDAFTIDLSGSAKAIDAVLEAC